MITPYRVTPVTPLGTADELAADLDRVQAVLAQVIATEGPVHRSVAYRRTAQSWQLETPDRMAERVLIKAASNLVRVGQIYVTGGDFFWPADVQMPPVRSRQTEGAPRDAALIAPAELAGALLGLLTERGSMPRELLLPAVAEVLAVPERPGLARGIDHLLAQGQAVEEAGVIRLA